MRCRLEGLELELGLEREMIGQTHAGLAMGVHGVLGQRTTSSGVSWLRRRDTGRRREHNRVVSTVRWRGGSSPGREGSPRGKRRGVVRGLSTDRRMRRDTVKERRGAMMEWRGGLLALYFNLDP